MPPDPGNAAAPAGTRADGENNVVADNLIILPESSDYSNDEMVRAATELRQAGYALCRIPVSEKRPVDDGWQLKSCEPEDFSVGQWQIGIITGPLSGGLVCVDVDGIEPEIADRYLPATQMEDGRPGRERGHRFYHLNDTHWSGEHLPGKCTAIRDAMESGEIPRFCGSKNYRVNREKGAPGVELKGAGTQVVIPPSIHTSGVCRVWAGGSRGEPAVLTYEELILAIEALMTQELGWRKPSGVSTHAAPITGWRPTGYDAQRAQAYIREMGPAVEGSGGDQHTYNVCCSILDFVDLETAWPILVEWNLACQPPWDEAGLRRKLNEAAGNRENPVGCRSFKAERPVAPNSLPDWRNLDLANAGVNESQCPGAIGLDGQQIEEPIRYIARTHDDRLRDHLNPPQMIIEGLLPAGGIGAIAAVPGIGKTLLAIYIAFCIAAGELFAGRFVTQGSVLYICPDSPASTERRMLAIPEEVANRIFTLTDMRSLPDGWGQLYELILGMHVTHSISLVIIDTWDSARSHEDGGYAAQDGITEEVMRLLRRIAGKLGIAILVIHHATRADGGRPRGSQVFDARADWIAVADKAGDNIVSLRSTKVRDGEVGDVGMWKIETVDVGDRPVPTLVEMPELKLGGGPKLDDLVYDYLGEHRPWQTEKKRIAAALRAGPRRGTKDREVEEAFYRLINRLAGFNEDITEGFGPRTKRLIGKGEPPPPPESKEERCQRLWGEHPDWSAARIGAAAGCSKSAADRARPASHEDRPV